jgi:hypothetical protein
MFANENQAMQAVNMSFCKCVKMIELHYAQMKPRMHLEIVADKQHFAN